MLPCRWLTDDPVAPLITQHNRTEQPNMLSITCMSCGAPADDILCAECLYPPTTTADGDDERPPDVVVEN
jgi:hypothetical protein